MGSIGVIGAGAFGTALGCTMAKAGHEVILWGRDGAQVAQMQSERRNRRYLPQIRFPDNLHPRADLSGIPACEAVLMVVPAQTLGGFLQSCPVSFAAVPVVLCAKGIQADTGLLQSQIAAAHGLGPDLAVLSGPGFAGEIAAGKPTALSLACENPDMGKRLQSLLSSESLRLYLGQDVVGVQLGGALKNVYAIACGLVIGAGLGESARAALMTRGFAEMRLLAGKMGASAETLTGLSGLGDLALTCGSPQSRNFAFGVALGRAEDFAAGQTVEGIATARAVMSLAQRYAVDMPVAAAVAAILEGKTTLPDALKSLMTRPLRQES